MSISMCADIRSRYARTPTTQESNPIPSLVTRKIGFFHN